LRPFFDGQRRRWLLALLQAESARNFFLTHAHCLMPDHLHFLSEGAHPMSDRLHFVKRLKLKSSRLYTARTGQTLWQKGFYEHILRPGDSIENVAWYIWLNPVRRGIVERPEQFAGSGSFSWMKMPTAWRGAGWLAAWK
jgi:putative transposase